MENWKDIPSHKLPGLCETNAQKWAEAFQQIVVDEEVKIDEGLMIGWFANIIEQAKMHVRASKLNLERLCMNCSHYKEYSYNAEHSHCMHPKNAIKSPITGKNLYRICFEARSTGGCCTPEGNLYKGRDT